MVGHEACPQGEDPAGCDVEDAARGHVEHRHEHGEQEERRAEVPLVDEDQEGAEGGDEDGAEVARLGDAQRTDLPVDHRHGLGPFREVGGEEHGDEHLGDLAWLEREHPIDEGDVDPHPQSRPVDGRPVDRQPIGEEREEQERHRGGQQYVPVPLENGDAARPQQPQHTDGHGRRDHERPPLEGCQVAVDPVDLDESDGREERRGR